MRKDGEFATVKYQPPSELAELRRRYRQLAASARVWSDRAEMIVALRNSKPFVSRVAKRFCLFDVCRIEIDMRMEIPDHEILLRLIAEFVQKLVDRCNGFGFVQFGSVADIRHNSHLHVRRDGLHFCDRIGAKKVTSGPAHQE